MPVNSPFLPAATRIEDASGPEIALQEYVRQRQERALMAEAYEAHDKRVQTGISIKAGASDALLGMVETPAQVFGGGSAGVQDSLKTFSQLYNWFDDSTGNRTKGAAALMMGISPSKIRPRSPDEVERNVFDSFSDIMPDIDEPDSVTGGLVRGFSKFIVPFMLVRGPINSAVTRAGATERVAEFATNVLATGTADALLAAESNLSNFIQDTPLANPINEMLAIEGDDGEVAKRLKSAAEGMGIAALSEPLIMGVRALRDWRQAAAKARGEKSLSLVDELRAQVGEITEADLKRVWGQDITAPLTETRKQVAEARLKEGQKRMAASEARVGQTTPEELTAQGPERLYINWGRIDTEEDVKSVIRAAANLDTPAIEDAKRLGRTLGKVKEEEYSSNFSVLDLLNRKTGQPLSDVESLRARKILTAASEKLNELMEAAINGGAAEQFAFRKMVVIHNAILKEVQSAGADASRALGAWRINAKSSVNRAIQIQAILDEHGGIEVSRDLALRMRTITDANARLKMIEKSFAARSMDAVKESYVMGLLWSPQTHIANFGSNSIVLFQDPAERLVAAGISKMMNRAPGEGVIAEEAAVMAATTIMSLKDAFIAAVRRARTGESQLGKATGQKFDMPVGKISSESFAPEVAKAQQLVSNLGMSQEGIGRVADYLNLSINIAGGATRAPGSALVVSDEFFKMIGYRAELAALAIREARKQGVERGLTRQEVKAIYADILQNPPESISIAAIDAAAYRTFTRHADGAIASALRRLRDYDHPMNLSYTILPFVNTPANVFSYGFERMPWPIALISKSWRADIAAGGARRDVALARTATGSAIMLLFMDLARDGMVTGSGPPKNEPARKEAWKRLGWQEDSIYIPGENEGEGAFVSWNRFDQLAPAFSFAAELNQVNERYDFDGESQSQLQEIIGAAAFAFAHATTDRSFTTGVGDLFDMLGDPNKNFVWYANERAKAFVPFSGAFRTAERIADPEIRDVNVFIFDALKSMLAGLSSTLPTKRDLWGYNIEPDPRVSVWYHTLSPYRKSLEYDNPIDEEMIKIGRYFARMKKKQEFSYEGKSVEVSFVDYPRAFERLQELAGHALVHPIYGKGAVEYLNDVVTGKDPLMGQLYAMMSDEDKGKFIENTIVEYRKLAREQLMQEPGFEKFQEYVKGEVKAMQSAELNALMGGPR